MPSSVWYQTTTVVSGAGPSVTVTFIVVLPLLPSSIDALAIDAATGVGVRYAALSWASTDSTLLSVRVTVPSAVAVLM